MSIEYTPVDLSCNLGCDYCYQEPMRDAGNTSSRADWEKAKKALIKHNHQFTLFGGEPLLAPIEHLEEVLAFGFERFGGNGIQTNGTLITKQHIELFKKYRVGVGISCDGPDELSDLRRARSSDDTRLHTNRTLAAIEALCLEGVIPSLIVTVHKMNGSTERRPKLMDWFGKLERIGIKHINLHPLEVEHGMEHLAMDEQETCGAFHALYRYSLVSEIHFQPFEDIRKLLLDDGQNVMCVWNACDPMTTAAVQGVSRNGTAQNCGRTNKDGINWVKADVPDFSRYIVLHQTPQEHGGCKDCQYFVFCKGNCPGTAIDGDWRNRTVHCATWYDLFATTEREIIESHRRPVTRDLGRMKILLDGILNKGTKSVNSHGDCHGDSPHGDSSSKGIEVTWL